MTGMEGRVAILRGINVGGKRKILMTDLKSMFEDLGFSGVNTYIQSGNVIFSNDDERNNTQLSETFEKAINKKFGLEVPVIVRSSSELEELAGKNPFYQDGIDINHLHLTFLNEEPTSENKKKTELLNYEPDKFIIEGKDVYIYYDGKYHQSKLTNNFFENKLKVSATTRNWKTVLKLLELSK